MGTQIAEELSANYSFLYLTGIEISARYEKQKIEILGYNFDPNNTNLISRLKHLQDARKDRIQKILTKLEEIEISISFEEIVKQLGSAISAGRPHFARALIAKGYVSSIDEAFEKYLAEGRPAYVRRVTIQPDEAIKIIHDAKGVAVLPHPLFIEVKDLDKLERMLLMLLDWGLDGIEVYYDYKNSLSFLSANQLTKVVNFLKIFSHENDLLITAGTDYHGDRGKIGDIDVPDEVIQNLINYFSE